MKWRVEDEDEDSSQFTPMEFEEDEAVETEVCRKADYLPNRVALSVGVRPQPVTWCQAYWLLFSGQFLDLHKKSKVEGNKESKLAEAANVGLISALFLTVLLPMLVANTEDFMQAGDEPYSDFQRSVLWSLLDKVGVGPGDVVDVIFDMNLFLYFIASWASAMSTVGCVLLILVCGLIDTGETFQGFHDAAGNIMKFPFMCCVVALLACIGLFMRLACQLRSWWTVVAMVPLVTAIGLGMVHFVAAKGVKAAAETLKAEKAFEPLSLSAGEVRKEVALYLEHEDENANLSGCLDSMCGITSSGKFVELNNFTQIRVAVEIHKQIAAKLGIGEQDLDMAMRHLG